MRYMQALQQQPKQIRLEINTRYCSGLKSPAKITTEIYPNNNSKVQVLALG